MKNTTLVLIAVVVLIILIGGYFIYYPKQSSYSPTMANGANMTVNTGTVCTQNWQCQWGPCVNGSQVQGAVDSNNCGTGQSTIACPALARLCTTQPVNLSASVSIQNFAFNPTPLNIKAGTTVTWTNNDSVPHQIKADTFNSAALTNGQTFSFTFSVAGTYNYSCAIHPSMHGQIVVTQ